MTIFLTLLGKIVPLYFSIVLGFLSTFLLGCQKETIAKIMLLILAPILVLKATMSVTLDGATIFLPTFFFLLNSVLAILLLQVFSRIWSDNTANLLAFSATAGNTGNIGIPLAILFLEPDLVDVFIFTILGSILYQNSVGYYITAKGNFTATQSIKKVLKLPVLYAFAIGIICNLYGIKIPEIFADYIVYLKGAYAILGMMLLGMGMEKIGANKSFDLRFITYALGMKFVVWPGLVLLFILIDQVWLHFLDPRFYMVMFLFSIVPLAANTVTIATLLDVKPEKMSLTVFISTIVSLFYIPFAIYMYTS